jgi:hypothetical protein
LQGLLERPVEGFKQGREPVPCHQQAQAGPVEVGGGRVEGRRADKCRYRPMASLPVGEWTTIGSREA